MTHSYSLNLADEVRKGMTEKALRGELQTPAPFGYVIENGVLTPDMANSETVRTVFRLFAHENMSSGEIAKYLNESGILTKKGNSFQKRSVDYILKNPVYAGSIRWNPAKKTNYLNDPCENAIIVKGLHQPIIDEHTFALAADKMSSFKAAPKHRANKHCLSGILKCMRCGGNMYYCGNIFRCGNYLNKNCRYPQGIAAAKIESLIAADIPESKRNTDLSEILRIVYFDKELGKVELIYQ